jgi:type II secretory pathway component GspD/PulD (secretin)
VHNRVRSTFVLILALSLPAAAHAQERRDTVVRSDAIDFSLEDADLRELVFAVSRITGRRFILAVPTRALQATVVSEGPVSASDVYHAFLSILRMNGLTVRRSGRYEVIIATDEIERRPIPLIIDSRGS